MLKYKILKDLKEKYENGLTTFKNDYANYSRERYRLAKVALKKANAV